MKSLHKVSEKIGINLNGPHKYKDFKILKGNANSMSFFPDNKFDLVLCNAMLEHDKYFWKTIEEIKRVTKPGGYIVIGTPGYTFLKAEKIKSILLKLPLIRKLRFNQYLDILFEGTFTLHIHNAPGDYYRFSTQAFKEVIFEGFSDIEVYSIMVPPRIIGVGRKMKSPLD
jgi:SAM-dependent methyltransferase